MNESSVLFYSMSLFLFSLIGCCVSDAMSSVLAQLGTLGRQATSHVMYSACVSHGIKMPEYYRPRCGETVESR